jgi:hypothetical protein
MTSTSPWRRQILTDGVTFAFAGLMNQDNCCRMQGDLFFVSAAVPSVCCRRRK